jgi:hypothetical protein
MMQFNGPTSPPSASSDAFAFAASLLALLSDPKTARRQLDDLKAATEKLAAVREEHEQSSVVRDRDFDERSSKRRAELDGQAQKLEEREAEHFKRVAAKETELLAREARAAELNGKAEAAAAAAAKLEAELKRRLRALEGAA